MKIRVFIYIGLLLMIAPACDRGLKEHPVPLSVKRELARQNNPDLKKMEISGTISVAGISPESIPKTARLFIIARPDGVEGGPPLAAKRHSLVKFPFLYNIGPANVMLEGNRFEGRLSITARLDYDGDARAKPGDIVGIRSAQAGEKNIDIVLDTVIERGKDFITGAIRIDPKLAASVPESWQLFVIARPEGIDRGPPLAVIRLQQGDFPYPFRLGQENTMMPGAVFEGALRITVRLDRDGDAKAGAGDIEGGRSVRAGDENVDIVLDRVVGG